MTEYAKLIFEGKTYEFPVVVGTEGEKAIDISQLRQQTGLITLDPGYANTGSCESAITFMDGEKGILRYRGIPIEQLAEHSSFIETAFLLINGRLPTREELNRVSVLFNDHSLVHEDMQMFYHNFPRASHPMGILSSMVNALRSFYPELQTIEEEINITEIRLLSKVRTMAAMSYKISRGHKVVYPRPDLKYCANFLNMMFDTPVKPYQINDTLVKALEVFWILHADHEQNCSTSTVRLVGSGRVNLYAAISAGISALWGPLHGGANQAVIEMLTEIHKDGGNYRQAIEKAKDKNDPFRLMGFGHRVYKSYDPRARIMKKMCDAVLEGLHITDPLLDIAKELEEAALTDDYFIEKNLYPNVDFYSGIVLRAMGIPTNMFTVMFAIGRLPGWIAQWKESMDDPKWKLGRPRQIYIGPAKMDYVPIDERKIDSSKRIAGIEPPKYSMTL
ncbi:MAG: citrate synthase [Desulfobacterales bacterium]|uniref:Citrate synthase n=1 Tax=Candidatus Desulfatibia profunda TaxID=2841695 RepID=A0A8J6NKR5_9BACT|nr:citrate synthase [Candidatus Desulfatibia profunda]MBL7178594.1 citrate synthase [Desulfobacterales bacterium]